MAEIPVIIITTVIIALFVSYSAGRNNSEKYFEYKSRFNTKKEEEEEPKANVNITTKSGTNIEVHVDI